MPAHNVGIKYTAGAWIFAFLTATGVSYGFKHTTVCAISLCICRGCLHHVSQRPWWQGFKSCHLAWPPRCWHAISLRFQSPPPAHAQLTGNHAASAIMKPPPPPFESLACSDVKLSAGSRHLSRNGAVVFCLLVGTFPTFFTQDKVDAGAAQNDRATCKIQSRSVGLCIYMCRERRAAAQSHC